jgi:choline dehydrogenase
VLHACREPVTLERAGSPGNLLRYLLTRGGPLASNVAEAGAFLRLADGVGLPDLELIAAPVAFVNHGFLPVRGPHFTVAAILLQPRSRGRVRLRSADPLAPPEIAPGYLSDPADLPLLVEGLRRVRQVVAQPAFDRWRGPEVMPGSAAASAGELAQHIRASGETLYHPVGTCRMGSDGMAVVDPALRVRGTEGLWVADASVMPVIPACHTNAPTIALAERAAEVIGGR